MSEERANDERPTVEAGTAENFGGGEGVADSERRGESSAAAVTTTRRQPRRRRRSQRPTKGVVVSGRLTDEDAEDFAYLRSSLGAASDSETIRTVVQIAVAAVRGDKFKSVDTNQVPGPDLDADTLARMHEVLRVNAEAHSEAAFQLQKIGNNVNQIARVANAGDTVPAEALDALRRPLERIEIQLNEAAQRDGNRVAKLRRIR